MMSYVFLKKSKIIVFVLFPLFSSAQFHILTKKDLNFDKIQDIIYKDTVNNTLVFKYGKSSINQKNDTIFFFSNYKAEAGSLRLKITQGIITVKFTYAPKYLDYDLLRFSYDKQKKDWFLIDILSSRTNPLSEKLITEICQYSIPKKLNFSLKKNNFDAVQENLLDNKKYLIKRSKKYLDD